MVIQDIILDVLSKSDQPLKPGDGRAGMVLAGLRVAGKGCGWRGMGSKAKIRGLGDQEGVSCQAGGFSLPADGGRFWEYFDGRASRGVLLKSLSR